MLRLYTSERFLDEDQSLKIALIDVVEDVSVASPAPSNAPTQTQNAASIPSDSQKEAPAKDASVANPVPSKGPTQTDNAASILPKGKKAEIDATIELWNDDSALEIKLVPLPRRSKGKSGYRSTLAFEIPARKLAPGSYEIRA